MSFTPIHFIGEEIQVHFDKPPALEKKPGCPQAFTWRGDRHDIVAMHSEWHDYARRGKFKRNMQPQHAEVASGRGSWGVGRDYYRIETASGQFFDLYYDRAPKDAAHRKGAWFLYRELNRENENSEGS